MTQSKPSPAPDDRVGGALRDLARVAFPTTVTMTSYTVMQLVDALMASRIGASEIFVGAQGNGGMLIWFAMSFALGTISVLSTYVSQHLGAGTPRKAAAYGWTGIWVALVWAAVMMALSPAIPWLFRSMGHPAELVRLESQYASISVLGCVFVLVGRALSQYFFGMHRASVVMLSVLLANVVNVALNALLIYGTDGPPAMFPLAPAFASLANALGIEPMGLAGAAWGTVVGSAFECLIPLAVFLSPAYARRFDTRKAWRPRLAHFRDLARLGWPSGLMTLNEMFCWAYLMIVLLTAAGAAAGDPPELHTSVGWSALRYMQLSFMPVIGLSFAVTAVVGKCMGMRRPDLAARRVWIALAIAMAYMGACGLAFVLLRHKLIGSFFPEGLDPATAQRMLQIGGYVMVAAAVFQVFDAVAITTAGALRGAGDTVWPGIITVLSSWVGLVGIGHLMILTAPGLGAAGPWIGASSYIFLLSVFLGWRFLRGKWKHIDLLARSAGTAPAPGTEVLAGGFPGEA